MPTSDFLQRGNCYGQQIVSPLSVSLGELFAERLEHHGERTTLVQQVDGVESSLSFLDVLRDGKIVSGLLREHGLGSGDTVMLCCGNTLQFAPIMLGTLFVGAALAPVNPAFIASDILHSINVTKPQVFICNDQAEREVKKALCQYNAPVAFIPMEAVKKRLQEDPDVEDFYLGKVDDPDSHVAFVMCSSGTTGKPKGVELTQTDSYYRMIKFLYKSFANNGEQEISLNMSGPFWGTCIMTTMKNLYYGYKLILLSSFTVESFLGLIHSHKINHVLIHPDHLVNIANYPSTEKYDLSSLVTVGHGGAGVSDAMLLRGEEKLRTKIYNMYGMTECMSTANTFDTDEKLQTIGRVMDIAEIKFADVDTGNALGPNKLGEIRVKSEIMFKKYRNNPEATKAAFDAEGYFCSGDIGYLDRDGHIYVIDRLKETFKYNGIFVPTRDIEVVLLQHPDVFEAAVVGVYNEKECTHSTAFIVRREGSSVTAQQLVDLVRDSLPEYKWLHGGAFLTEELPKTATGKVLKHELRKTYERILFKQ